MTRQLFASGAGRRPRDRPLGRDLLVALLVSSLAACTSTPEPSIGLGRTPSAPTTPSPSSPPSQSVAPAPREITLAFAGDVHFARRTLTLLEQPATAFGPVAQLLRAADVAMVNLETAVTERGTPEPKRYHFRAPESAYAAVRAAGIDVVSLANNHALDYGRVGLADTLDSAAAHGVPVVGAGRNVAGAYAPWVTTVDGVTIAFLGLSQIAELSWNWSATAQRSGIAYAFDLARATEAVRVAKRAADVVVVYLHWGQEYHQCPTTQMRRLAANLAEAGADLLVGTHAHVLVGDGWLGDTFVSYGLSNFVWWFNDAGSNDTGVLRVTLRGARIVRTEFVPAYIDRVTGQPIPSTGQQKDRI
ncbi:MAG TPA: CapA family protein, partial [Micromonosporaceae bacterium]